MRIASKTSAAIVVLGMLTFAFYWYERQALNAKVQKRVQNMLLVKMYVGKIKETIVTTSAEPPSCLGGCRGVERILITLKGSHGQMQIATDMDVKKNRFRNFSFCDMNGTLLGRSRTTSFPLDGKYCK